MDQRNPIFERPYTCPTISPGGRLHSKNKVVTRKVISVLPSPEDSTKNKDRHKRKTGVYRSMVIEMNAPKNCWYSANYKFCPRCNDNPTYDNINHPPHYTNHPSGIECIQITEHMGFCLGNAVKYI